MRIPLKWNLARRAADIIKRKKRNKIYRADRERQYSRANRAKCEAEAEMRAMTKGKLRVVYARELDDAQRASKKI